MFLISKENSQTFIFKNISFEHLIFPVNSNLLKNHPVKILAITFQDGQDQFDKVTEKRGLAHRVACCAKKLNCCLTIHSSTMPTTSPGGRAWARNTIWTEPYQ